MDGSCQPPGRDAGSTKLSPCENAVCHAAARRTASPAYGESANELLSALAAAGGTRGQSLNTRLSVFRVNKAALRKERAQVGKGLLNFERLGEG